jgi:hypothetical protein
MTQRRASLRHKPAFNMFPFSSFRLFLQLATDSSQLLFFCFYFHSLKNKAKIKHWESIAPT